MKSLPQSQLKRSPASLAEPLSNANIDINLVINNLLRQFFVVSASVTVGVRLCRR